MAAHRYWRVYVTDTLDGSVAVVPLSIATVELRSSIGGSDQATGGSAIQSTGTGSNAFDGMAATDYTCGFGESLPQWVGYDAGVGNTIDVAEVYIVASLSTETTAPRTFAVESSDNASTWVEEAQFASEPNWTSGEGRAYTVAVTTQTGVTSMTLRHVPLTQTGTSSMTLRHVIAQSGVTSMTLRHVPITSQTGTSAMILRHVPYQAGTSSMTLRHVPQAATMGNHWQNIVILNGVDVSNRLTEQVTISAKRDSARTASFVLKPLAGSIDAQEWVKQSVTIDYATYNSAGVLQTKDRRFTGLVHEATYDPQSRLTSFECSDNLQDSLEGQDFSLIDNIIGGYYSSAVFADTDNGWEYAQQRLQTIPASYDRDVQGAGRVWQWQAESVAAFAFTDADIIDDSLTLTQNSARDIINSIDIDFKFRYPRKWQREISTTWHYPQSIGGYLTTPTTIPTRDMVREAIGSNWWVKSLMFLNMPGTGAYVNNSGDLTAFFLSEENRNTLVWSMQAKLASRWVQDVIEHYQLTVNCSASIAEFGEVSQSASYAVDAEEEDDFAEMDTGALVTSKAADDFQLLVSPSYQAPPSGATSSNGLDYYLDSTDRTDFGEAIQTAVAIAKTDILESHHANEVGYDCLVYPGLDIGKTAQVSTTEITTKGVITSLEENYDIDNGTALASVAISVYAPNVASQADTAVAVPTPPDLTPFEAAPDITLSSYFGGENLLPVNENWRGYIGNYTGGKANTINTLDRAALASGVEIYPVEFRMETPAIEDELRDETTFAAASTINTAIPQELLTITA